MRLFARRIVAALLRFVPWSLVDLVRRWHLASAPGGVRARALGAVLNVMRHRRISSSVSSVRIQPLDIVFTNDDSVLTRRLFYLGEYEAGEWLWWDHWCRRSERVVELGANTGLYSVVGGRARSSEEYVAVEPHPHTARVLRRNLALNGISRVRVVEAAVVGKREQPRMELHVPIRDRDATPTGAFLSTRANDEDGSRESITVDVVEAGALLGEADLIKMDIEGQELAVLRSVEEMLAVRKPTIFLELRSGSTDLRAYVPTLCRRCGYRAFAISGPRLHPVDLDALPGMNFNRTFGTRDVILTTATDAESYRLASFPRRNGAASA